MSLKEQAIGMFENMLGQKGQAAAQVPGAPELFGQLKAKYQTVLSMIQDHQVQLQNLHVENGKLYMKGTASSDAVKNSIWEQVKKVDATYSDLTLDLSVAPGAVTSGAGATATSAGMESYAVKSGDSLSKIAQHYYGDAKAFMKIFEANRDILKDPNLIQPGQLLKIPKA